MVDSAWPFPHDMDMGVPAIDREVTVLRHELVNQCWAAQTAWAEPISLTGLSNVPGIKADRAIDNPVIREVVLRWHSETWADVLVILAAAGIVSRLLFPPEPKRGSRASDRHWTPEAELRRFEQPRRLSTESAPSTSIHTWGVVTEDHIAPVG
jgi:hypothetical protein